MSTHYQLVKQSLLEGLKWANYDVKRLQPAPIKAGFFVDRTKIQDAERTARSIVQTINVYEKRGENMSRDNLEKIIERESASRAFTQVTGLISLHMKIGKGVSPQHIQEAREALAVLEKYPESAVRIYKQQFKQLIGEE